MNDRLINLSHVGEIQREATVCTYLFTAKYFRPIREVTNTGVCCIEFNYLNQNQFQHSVEEVGPEYVGFIGHSARRWLNEKTADFFLFAKWNRRCHDEIWQFSFSDKI